MRIRKLIILMFVLLGCTHLSGQDLRKETSIGFRVGKSVLDTAYVDNAGRLQELVSFLEDLKSDTMRELVKVEFWGSASPEGSWFINRRLSNERRSVLEDYVRRNISLPDSIVASYGEVTAWEQLARLVEQSDMPHKEEAVDVLRNVPLATYDARGVLIDSRKKHLMELQYGRTWHYMADHFFPQIRHARVVLMTVLKNLDVPEPVMCMKKVAAAPMVKVQEAVDAQAGPKKPFYMALKTNMLYDVLAVPNIGAEFYLGSNWSASADWMYAWWNSDKKHRYWRVYGGEVAVRKWFGRKAAEKPLTGHHLGVYGQLFTYDVEWNGIGYMGGQPGQMLWDSPNYAVGIEYGYSLPIGRRLNIDFTVGVGYWGGKYYTYRPLDGHYVWEVTKKRHWFGPTKAEISLVWLIGRGNTNDMKGGVK